MSECIYVLLPVYNRVKVTTQFIDSLQAQTWDNYHLVLIDDGSTDGTAQMVRSRIDRLTVIQGAGNWWWAGCLQQGFNYLNEQEISMDSIILIINDDVVFGEEFFETGAAQLKEIPNALLLAQFQDEWSDSPQESGLHADLRNFSFSTATSSGEINCLSTRGLFLKWYAFLEIGGFHPVLLPHYWSDYEFTIRAHKKGFQCMTTPEVLLQPNLMETGRDSVDYNSFCKLLKSLFSIKTIANPIYRITFVFLACPKKWIPRNLVKILFSVLLINMKYPIFKFNKILAQRKVRKQIQWKIKKQVKENKDDYRIVVGAGGTEYTGWISTDYPTVDISEPHSLVKYFPVKSIKAILSEHVFEHLTAQETKDALAQCKDYLAPGGYLRIAVPDGFHPDKEYIRSVKPNGDGAGSDDHKILYNYESLITILKSSGFQVRPLEWFDQEGKFHFVEWQPETGFVQRSSRFDKRNKHGKLVYTSLIVDAVKLQ